MQKILKNERSYLIKFLPHPTESLKVIASELSGSHEKNPRNSIGINCSNNFI